MQPRVLLLNWAGADWQLLQPLLDAGRMPQLHSLVQRGAMGKLVSAVPLHAVPLAASLVTGRHADEHGVLAWTRPDVTERDMGPGVCPVGPADWQAPPLWALLHKLGLPACAVGFPATHPVGDVVRVVAGDVAGTVSGPGVVVSDAYATAAGADFEDWPLPAAAVSDPALAEALAALRLHPADISAEQVQTFLPQAARIDQETDARLGELVVALAEAATVHSAATHLVEHQPWQLLAVHFDFIEQLSARFMAYRAPRRDDVTATDHAIYGEAVDGAYQFMDLMLGRYLALVDAQTHVLVVSAHGFHAGTQRSGPLRRPGDDARAYRPLGLMVAAGPQVRPDDLVFGAHTLDIAPTVLHLLGLPVPAEMPGRVLARMLNADAVQPPPPAAANAPAAVSSLTAPPPAADTAWAARRLVQLAARGLIAPLPADTEAAAEQAEITVLDHRAQALLSRGLHAPAVAVLQRLAALSPDRPATALMQAQCALATNDLATAAAVLQALRASGHSGLALDLAQVQLQLRSGQGDAAAALLLQLEAQADGNVAALEQAARAHLQMRRWADAERCYQAALALDANHAHVLAGLGRARAAQGDAAGAVPLLMRSLSQLFVQPEVHHDLGRCLAVLGRTAQAQAAVLRALELRPDFEAARLTLLALQRAGVAAALDAARAA